MFTNKSFSNVGRKTAQSIDTLKKRLALDDASADGTLPSSPARSLSETSLQKGSTQDLIQRFSRRKVKALEPKQEEEPMEEALSIPRHVKQAAPLQSSSVFRCLGREDLDKRLKNDEVPPVGSYSPKDDCTAALSRVKHPPPRSCSFAAREITRSRKVVLAERLREQGQPYEHLLEKPGRELPELPENPLARKKQIVFVDMSKQLPRPDLLQSRSIVSHETIAISSSGFEEAHKKCAKFGKFYRQPCYAISQLPRSEKTQESFTQPGEFNVNLDFVRPRLQVVNVDFQKRPGRKADLRGEEKSFSRGLATHSFSRLEPGPMAKVLQPVYFKFREHHGRTLPLPQDFRRWGGTVRSCVAELSQRGAEECSA
ncbi:unnamed protein product [Symbiodinium natans]|uniref:Uncharacterized protein n=1 Tax=Symbiodinium natans TaxID=878477 RepID=A0A812TC69_9DINO|nr:unnamed protein product [Symbiodinium natans]